MEEWEDDHARPLLVRTVPDDVPRFSATRSGRCPHRWTCARWLASRHCARWPHGLAPPWTGWRPRWAPPRPAPSPRDQRASRPAERPTSWRAPTALASGGTARPWSRIASPSPKSSERSPGSTTVPGLCPGTWPSCSSAGPASTTASPPPARPPTGRSTIARSCRRPARPSRRSVRGSPSATAMSRRRQLRFRRQARPGRRWPRLPTHSLAPPPAAPSWRSRRR